jgi:uroporphyrinogen-III synthase
MTKYVIMWDVGYGPSYEAVEAADKEAAQKWAYEAAREEFESNANYPCIGEATEELCEEYGV